MKRSGLRGCESIPSYRGLSLKIAMKPLCFM